MNFSMLPGHNFFAVPAFLFFSSGRILFFLLLGCLFLYSLSLCISSFFLFIACVWLLFYHLWHVEECLSEASIHFHSPMPSEKVWRNFFFSPLSPKINHRWIAFQIFFGDPLGTFGPKIHSWLIRFIPFLGTIPWPRGIFQNLYDFILSLLIYTHIYCRHQNSSTTTFWCTRLNSI